LLSGRGDIQALLKNMQDASKKANELHG